MKKIILLLSCIFIFLCSFAQLEEYPKIVTDSVGNKTVIFTLEQVRIIDNKLDILELFEQSDNLSSGLDSICIKVIDDKNNVIALQDIQIDNLTQSNSLKDEEIDNLNFQISKYIRNEVLYDKELKNKDEEIELHLDKMRDFKKKTIIGGIVGGGIITGLVILLLTK